ncbi:hypothetical protein [Phormidesmis priestleyi]
MQRRFWKPLKLKAAHRHWLTGGLTALLLNSFGSSVSAQTVLFQETFRGTSTSDIFLSGGINGFPCLTAATPATATAPSIPACAEGATDPAGSGALRITANGPEQRGFVIYDRFIQSQFGLSITFDFFSYNGIGAQRADGITFFLLDTLATPTQAGSFGGSLGYAQRSFGGGVPDEPGITGGYLGIGFDEFGNFANDAEGRGAGFVAPGAPLPPGCEASPFGREPDPATRTIVPDSVTLRGRGEGTAGYCFLANSGTRPEGIDVPTATRTAARRTARITLKPGPNPTVQVEIDFGAGFQTVIAERFAPAGLPERFRFGFAASTGTFTNFHEIQNLVVRSLVPAPQAQLGVAKQVGSPVNNNDGTFTIPYLVTVQNPSPLNLTSLQVTDDLNQTFAGVPFSIVPGSVRSDTLQVNPNYNGSTDINFLAGTDALTSGQTATINFSVRLTPGTVTRTFFNSAIGTARDPNNNLITDVSTNGVTPDANGNGNPGDDNTPTPVNPAAQLRLVKRITAITRNGVQTRFDQFVDDPNDLNDTAPGFSQLSPVGLANLDRTNPLRSGDEAEYTVYYLSDGTQPIFLANICDPIPVGTTFVANSLAIRRGNAESAGGSFFSPLAPLPPNNSCPDQTNARGAALFDLGTISNTTGDNFGFVRFRARVN